MRPLRKTKRALAVEAVSFALIIAANCGEEEGEIAETGGSGGDAVVSVDGEDTAGAACEPACRAYGRHSVAECVDGSCEYRCEEGWFDANEDYSAAGQPDPEGDGCEYECSTSNGGEEACDGEDNDCDGEVDEDFAVGDVCEVGQGVCAAEGELVCGSSGERTECDAVPGDGQDEVCGDDMDNDCDGEVDENDTVDAETWYEDKDGDGHGNAESTKTACEKPEGYVASGDDCDDGDDTVWKEMTGFEDKDGDGYTTGGEQTLCTDGTLPEEYREEKNGEDCDDNDDSVWEEVTGYKDADGDDWTTGGEKTFCTQGELPENYQPEQAAGDCNDDDKSVNPGAKERCNGIDDDCDDKTDEDDAVDAETWYQDCDGDTYAPRGASQMTQCYEPSSAPSDCNSDDPGEWTTREPDGDDTEDCWDFEPKAFPGQSKYFASGYIGGTVHDYNCDGTEEYKWSKTECSSCDAEYWSDEYAPDCGDEGTLVTCYLNNDLCKTDGTTKTQKCH